MIYEIRRWQARPSTCTIAAYEVGQRLGQASATHACATEECEASGECRLTGRPIGGRRGCSIPTPASHSRSRAPGSSSRTRWKQGTEIWELELEKPPGRRGYVMEVSCGARRIYIKLELGAGIIIGRSFHYSEK